VSSCIGSSKWTSFVGLLESSKAVRSDSTCHYVTLVGKIKPQQNADIKNNLLTVSVMFCSTVLLLLDFHEIRLQSAAEELAAFCMPLH